jgi:hypothetical protein
MEAKAGAFAYDLQNGTVRSYGVWGTRYVAGLSQLINVRTTRYGYLSKELH